MLSGFGLVLLVGYCFLEFVLGYVLTVALRWFFHGQEMDFFDWKFQYLLVRPGFSEVRIEIGKFEWRNPAKFSKFKNFVKQIVYLYIGIIDQIGLCFRATSRFSHSLSLCLAIFAES